MNDNKTNHKALYIFPTIGGAATTILSYKTIHQYNTVKQYEKQNGTRQGLQEAQTLQGNMFATGFCLAGTILLTYIANKLNKKRGIKK